MLGGYFFMKLFLLLFVVFFIFYSIFGKVKITYTCENNEKKEKIGKLIEVETLLITLVLSVLSSGAICLVLTAIVKFVNLLF